MAQSVVARTYTHTYTNVHVCTYIRIHVLSAMTDHEMHTYTHVHALVNILFFHHQQKSHPRTMDGSASNALVSSSSGAILQHDNQRASPSEPVHTHTHKHKHTHKHYICTHTTQHNMHTNYISTHLMAGKQLHEQLFLITATAKPKHRHARSGPLNVHMYLYVCSTCTVQLCCLYTSLKWPAKI